MSELSENGKDHSVALVESSENGADDVVEVTGCTENGVCHNEDDVNNNGLSDGIATETNGGDDDLTKTDAMKDRDIDQVPSSDPATVTASEHAGEGTNIDVTIHADSQIPQQG